jgi:hypothetical protein
MSSERVIHVRFEGGEELPILFANHIFVRPTPDGFLVSFAQSHGPYLVNATPDELEKLGVAAKVICRLIIPINRIHELARIFQGMANTVTVIKEESPNDNPAIN